MEFTVWPHGGGPRPSASQDESFTTDTDRMSGICHFPPGSEDNGWTVDLSSWADCDPQPSLHGLISVHSTESNNGLGDIGPGDADSGETGSALATPNLTLNGRQGSPDLRQSYDFGPDCDHDPDLQLTFPGMESSGSPLRSRGLAESRHTRELSNASTMMHPLVVPSSFDHLDYTSQHGPPDPLDDLEFSPVSAPSSAGPVSTGQSPLSAGAATSPVGVPTPLATVPEGMPTSTIRPIAMPAGGSGFASGMDETRSLSTPKDPHMVQPPLHDRRQMSLNMGMDGGQEPGPKTYPEKDDKTYTRRKSEVTMSSSGATPRGPRATPGRRDSVRRRITREQTESLEAAFQRNPKPDREQRDTVAEKIGLEARSVQIWFQNRRAKDRNQKQQNEKAQLENKILQQHLQQHLKARQVERQQLEARQGLTENGILESQPHHYAIPSGYAGIEASLGIPPYLTPFQQQPGVSQYAGMPALNGSPPQSQPPLHVGSGGGSGSPTQGMHHLYQQMHHQSPQLQQMSFISSQQGSPQQTPQQAQPQIPQRTRLTRSASDAGMWDWGLPYQTQQFSSPRPGSRSRATSSASGMSIGSMQEESPGSASIPWPGTEEGARLSRSQSAFALSSDYSGAPGSNWQVPYSDLKRRRSVYGAIPSWGVGAGTPPSSLSPPRTPVGSNSEFGPIGSSANGSSTLPARLRQRSLTQGSVRYRPPPVRLQLDDSSHSAKLVMVPAGAVGRTSRDSSPERMPDRANSTSH